MKKKLLLLLMATMLSTRIVSAHCPLCTIGAAAAAGGAAALGVNSAAIGVFIGAFAVSMGWWFSNVIKKRFIPYQKIALIGISFITTIIPMLPLLGDKHPAYISWIGTYGTTLVIDVFLVGAILGGIITSSTPWLSKKISDWRDGKLIPYQGISLTLSLLLLMSILLQVII